MVALETVTIALELMKLGMSAIEAANAGDEPAARKLLMEAGERVKAAGNAWDAAGKPGDDIGE